MARKYRQGLFRPKNPEKYVGDPNNIVFRSGWEKKVFNWCDIRHSIVHWASEEMYVPYVSPVDNKMHRYFVDLLIAKKGADGKITNYAVEIKPYAQTQPPKPRKRKTRRLLEEQLTYEVNVAKWNAAKAYFDKRGIKFIILTEREIFNKK